VQQTQLRGVHLAAYKTEVIWSRWRTGLAKESSRNCSMQIGDGNTAIINRRA